MGLISGYRELKMGVRCDEIRKEQDYALLILDLLSISRCRLKPSVYKWFKRMLSSDRSQLFADIVFVTSETKESFVSRTNALVFGTLISA